MLGAADKEYFARLGVPQIVEFLLSKLLAARPDSQRGVVANLRASLAKLSDGAQADGARAERGNAAADAVKPGDVGMSTEMSLSHQRSATSPQSGASSSHAAEILTGMTEPLSPDRGVTPVPPPLPPPPERRPMRPSLKMAGDAVHRSQSMTKFASGEGTFGSAVLAAFDALQQFRKRLARARERLGDDSFLKVFQEVDPESYGHVNQENFRLAISRIPEFSGLPEVQQDFIFRLADERGNKDANVDYREFYDLLVDTAAAARRTPSPSNAAADGGEDGIVAAVVITRHGARLPLKPFPGDLSWPTHQDFWKRFGGKLTSVGHEQHRSLGSRFRRRYVGESTRLSTTWARGSTVEEQSEQVRGKLLPASSPDLGALIRVVTSGSDRTLDSAQSFVAGLVPRWPQAFSVEGERDGAGSGDAGGAAPITVTIADLTVPYTPLLHGFKRGKRYNALRHKAVKQNKWFSGLLSGTEGGEYERLTTKLHSMTEFAKIAPGKGAVQRLQAFQSVAQELAIERSHRMEIFRNAAGLRLNAADEARVRHVADTVCRLRYEGDTHAEQREMSRLAAGTLPAAVVAHFDAAARGGAAPRRAAPRLLLLSAHDNTLMALLAHLGVRGWPIPQFAAAAVFELRRCGGEFRVTVAYNAHPHKEAARAEDAGSAPPDPVDPHLLALLPAAGGVIPWDVASGAAEPGDGTECHRLGREGMPADDFRRFLVDERSSLMSDEAWLEAQGGLDEAGKDDE